MRSSSTTGQESASVGKLLMKSFLYVLHLLDFPPKSITLEMNHEQALALFQDKVAWSIVSRRDNGSETVEEEYDNSAFSIAGDVTDHRNGTVTVKMGALTEAEELMAFIEGGETQ